MQAAEALPAHAASYHNPLRRRLADELHLPTPQSMALAPVLRRSPDSAVLSEEERLEAFFGHQAAPFLAHWRRREARGGGFALSWSWAALFSGSAWYLYRKMYLTGLLLVLAPIALALAMPSSGVLSAALGLLPAVIARSCYVSHALGVLRRFEGLELTAEEERRALGHAGGTSVLGGLLGIVMVASGWLLALVVNGGFDL